MEKTLMTFSPRELLMGIYFKVDFRINLLWIILLGS